MLAPSWRVSMWLLFIFALVIFLLTCHRFPGEVDVKKFSSGIFDADVKRVVENITSWQSSTDRLRVHPLFFALITPVSLALGKLINVDAFANAQITCCLGILAQLFLVMVLAKKLASGSPLAAPIAGTLFITSFSAGLFSVIPETCSWSGISGLLPMLLCAYQSDKRMSLGEMLLWAVLVPLTFGYTVTQVSFWFIGFFFRALSSVRLGRRALGMTVLGGGLAFFLGAFITWNLMHWEQSLNNALTWPTWQKIFHDEKQYSRPLELSAITWAKVSGVMKQMLIYPFVPPVPGYSRLVLSLGYFSLSLEEANPQHQAMTLNYFRLLATTFIFLPLITVRLLDLRIAAVAVGVLSQIVLHCFYGREFILYSLNWLGLLAVLVSVGTTRWKGRLGGLWMAGLFIVIPNFMIHNAALYRRIVAEVSFGLESDRRDANGNPSIELSSSEIWRALEGRR